MISLSIIVVTYNSQDLISDCLDSIFVQKNPGLEVIVVDNGSEDNTLKVIKDNFPEVILICNEKNLGFSVAVNQGIEKATGEYILTLNSDITLERNFIEKLCMNFKRLPNDNIGMISPKILDINKKIDSTGLVLGKLRRFYDRGRGSRDQGQFNSPAYIFGSCAACAIYKREMLKDIKIGEEYFDEDFFLVLEDFDIAWRANLLGWKGYFIPEVKCFHQGGVSRIKSELSQYYTFRNRYLLLIKNESLGGLIRLIILVWIYDLPRLIYLLFTNKYTFRALREIKQLLPVMIQKRNFIKRKIKV